MDNNSIICLKGVTEYRVAEGYTLYRNERRSDCFAHSMQDDTYGILLCTKGSLAVEVDKIACPLVACSLLLLFPQEEL